MKELDLLKKDWKKNENSFEQISAEEIYKMIHKRSSSLVKWILIISILEFIVLNGLGLLLNDANYDKILEAHPYLGFLEKLNYLIIIVFIYLFYRNYREISVLNSSKKLIEIILKTRKVVTYYIFYNIIFGGLIGAYSGAALKGFNDGYNAGAGLPPEPVTEQPTNYVALFIATVITMGFVWLFYKLVYGRFLNKLSKNHKELEKIDF